MRTAMTDKDTVRIDMAWEPALDHLGADFDGNAWVVRPTADNVEEVAAFLATGKVKYGKDVGGLLDSLRNPWKMYWSPMPDDVAESGYVVCEWPSAARSSYGEDFWRFSRVNSAADDMPNRRKVKASCEGREAWMWPLVGMVAQRTLTLAEKENLDLDPKLKAALVKAGLEYEAAATGSYAVTDDGKLILPGRFQNDLYPYQRAAVALALERKRLLIADDVGMGKTIEALGLIATVDTRNAGGKTLVVTTAVMRTQWKFQINQWLPGWQVYIVDSGDALLNSVASAEADIIICSYSLLEKNDKMVNLLKKLGLRCIIVDESHRVKNRNSAQAQAVYRASRGVEYRLLLTATPIPNSVDELQMQAEILDRLGEIGGSAWFRKKFGNGKFDPYYLDLLNEMLRKSFLVRRDKSQVTDQLPEIIFDQREVELSNREEYDKAERNFVQWLLTTQASDAEFDAAVAAAPKNMREQMIQDRIDAMTAKARRIDGSKLGKLAALRHIAAVGKIEAAVETVDESDAKTIIFAHHRETIAGIAAQTGAAIIVGGDTDKYRDEAKRRFQEDADCTRIAVSQTAGGEGLDLYAAERIVDVEKDWVPGRERQKIGRAHRIGNKNKSLTVVTLHAADTVDDDIQKVLDRKGPALKRIMDTGNDLSPVDEEGLADEVIRNLIARKGITWKYGVAFQAGGAE